MPKFTLKDFKNLYPDDDACLDKVFRLKYSGLKECPNIKCRQKPSFHRVKKRKCYECANCGHQLYPLAGTPLHGIRTPLTHVFMIIFMQTTTRNGVSAKEIQRMLGVTYKTAFSLGHRVRKLMTLNNPKALKGGTVEVDDFWAGGSLRHMHARKRRRMSTMDNKYIVVGMVQRDGAVITRVIDSTKHEDYKPVIDATIDKETVIYTDSFEGFPILFEGYLAHETVNHKTGEYVRGPVHGNTVEGFFSQISKTLSTHVKFSKKYLQLYTEECAWRYMNRNKQEEMFELILKNFCVG